MVFSSTLFLFCFLPVFFLLYYFAHDKLKNYVILAGSIVFYVWGAPLFIFILLASIILDFTLALQIHKSHGPRRRLFLIISIVINTGILLYFKYFNFFIDNVNSVLSDFGAKQIEFVRVALPIGISFFTFHELSYIIDVYRGVKPPLKKITDYAVYILLFPQLIAGPIIRFNEISDQIQNRNDAITIDNCISGVFRFIIGLSKKVLIANVLGAEADRIFALPHEQLTSPIAWMGALAYTFQIYFDFSGYSDMAIGLARMMGFVFPENFNLPYISQNITEFWRRWHMSLSRWMRDYLYIPLGGNKVSNKRMYFNLCLVFLISGFWHGAQWTFIFWGAYHGAFLILDRLFLIKATGKIGKYPRIILTFFIVVIGWVFFRAETISEAFTFLRKMFSFDFTHSEYYFNAKFISFTFLAVFIAISGAIFNEEKTVKAIYGIPAKSLWLLLKGITLLLLFVICAAEIAASGFNPFIYFRF